MSTIVQKTYPLSVFLWPLPCLKLWFCFGWSIQPTTRITLSVWQSLKIPRIWVVLAISCIAENINTDMRLFTFPSTVVETTVCHKIIIDFRKRKNKNSQNSFVEIWGIQSSDLMDQKHCSSHHPIIEWPNQGVAEGGMCSFWGFNFLRKGKCVISLMIKIGHAPLTSWGNIFELPKKTTWVCVTPHTLSAQNHMLVLTHTPNEMVSEAVHMTFVSHWDKLLCFKKGKTKKLIKMFPRSGSIN